MDENSILVRYSSKRPGLWPIVQGIIETVASKYYSKEVEVKLKQEEELPAGGHLYTLEVHCDRLNVQEAMVNTSATSSTVGLTAEQFYQLFPFHLVIRRDLTIEQAGHVIERLLRRDLRGAALLDVFNVVSPRVLSLGATFDKAGTPPRLSLVYAVPCPMLTASGPSQTRS